MKHAAPGPRPKESEFYDPVVYLLGRLTNFKPYVGVPHTIVRDDALRLVGIDPENCPWPLKDTSTKKRDGLYRVVHFAWYHQTRKYRRDSNALCGKPAYAIVERLENDLYDLLELTEDESDLLRDPYASVADKKRVKNTMKQRARALDSEDTEYHAALVEEIRELRAKARGEWALTDLGVKRAKELRDKYEGKIVLSAGPNATAKYLGDNFERLYDRIAQHIGRKMPRSEEFGKVEDHVMNWMDRIIQRDGLRTRIESGKSIPPSQVQAWARRGAYTDIRNEGREPVTRTFHGALTKREIGLYDPSNWTEVVVPRTINSSENLGVNTYAEHSEDDVLTDVMDNLQDDHVTADVESAILDEDALDHALTRCASVLESQLDAGLDPAWHQQIMVEHFVKEMTAREIAEAHGIKSVREVSKSLNRVRAAMLRARDEGEFDEFIRR
jgi:DNA-directed RNA polymerase specialized sigma24 family protein